MWKPVAVVAATVLSIFGIASLAGAAAKKPKPPAKPPANDVSVVWKFGRSTNVPAGKYVFAYAYCPKSYYATGGGVYNGAIQEIASGPTKNLSGWFAYGFNPDKSRTFQHRADVVCIKGSTTVRVGAVAAGADVAAMKARGDFAAIHGDR